MHPAASAGMTLHVIWLIGQFQGVIMPQTPIGSFTGDCHVVRHPCKNRGPYIIALVQSVGFACAAGYKLGAFIDTNLDEVLDFLPLGL